MNTKFPINGRYTTLGDLIHEYGKYSNYPDTGYTTDSGTVFPNTNLWDTANYPMPFVQLIYAGDPANNQNALYPYNVVWFDNVYSYQVDSTTKRMKIVQEQDSSLLNFDTPVFANDIKNKDAIRTGRFKFRFILPDIAPNNPDHYYYNYKTSDNEAVVIYALRNLLEITDSSIYYFGNGSNDVFQIDTSNNFLPLFNISDVNLQKYIFEIENNEIKSVKADAYKYLGDYFWTVMYVQHENYTSKVKYHDGFTVNNDNFPNSVNTNLHKYIMKSTYSAVTNKSDEVVLKELAVAMAGGSVSDAAENPNYKYTYDDRKSFAKIFYFLSLFLNSQRFFVSHVTSFEYVNISNMSYSLSQPILRCDLGLFRIIEYVTITKAVQIADTVLPPWGLDADTKIDISITYKIKYKDIPLLKDGNSILSFTLKDFWNIKDNDNTPDEEGKIKRWVRLVQPGSYGEVSLGVISKDDVSDNENPAFGSTEQFGTNHFLQPIDKNQPSYSDCSLGTLKWPFNDPDLQVADEHSLKLLAGNTSENTLYASTANTKLFGGKSWDDLKNDNYAPFGYLRIFDYLDNKLIDSSFIINVPILRCKNWWYESVKSNSIDTANIASYFDKLYLDAQIAEPEPTIGIYTNTYAYGNDPNNIQKILDKLNTLPIAAPTLIGTVDIRQYFGTKIGKATKWVYASGASEIDPNSLTTPEYTSNNPMYFETMNSALGAWTPKHNYIISRTHTSNTADQYDMGTDYRTPVTGIYTLCRVYIDVDEQGKPKDNTKCFYFKVTNATHTTGNKINVTFLTYKDTNSKYSAGEHTLGFSDHRGITASFILYNYNKPDDITGIGTGSPSNTLTINALLLVNQSSRDITIIDDEYNNFILSSLTVPNAFLLIKYHDTEAIYNILHLFHYGLKNNKPVVCFKNPKEMFHYPYPAIIDDSFDPSSISFEPITLESKFINTDNLLTTDRTLYFSLNNIFAFLDLSDSTVIVSSDLVVDCPKTKFSLGGVTYFDTNKLKDSITFSAAAPGIVMSFVSDNVFLTTKNILVQGSSTLSDYLNDLKNRNILISIVIQLFNFKNTDEINFNTTPTNITVTTSTKNDYNLKYIDPDSLTILKFRIELYKEDTSTDTFTVYLANSGWRGNDSINVVIFAIKIPAIGSTPSKTIGNVNSMDITDDQILEIASYNNKFPNGTEVYVGVPEVSYEIGSGDNKTWCKHTGWAIDTIPYGSGAPRTIHFSNISESGKYMSQRTVYALFADFTSNTGGGTTPTVPEYGFTINIDEPSHINKTGTNTNSTYPENSPISIEIVAIEGYRITSATMLPNIATFADNKFVFNMPALNVTITVTTEAVHSS